MKKLGRRENRRCMVWVPVAAAVLMSLAGCGGKNWTTDRERDCRVFDPQPVSTQSIRWEGPCHEGYASGYGVLSVFEGKELRYLCEGTLREGRMDGTILFSVIEEGKSWQYEESWVEGGRRKRMRNVELDKRLAAAGNAREYLLLLARYRKENPDAWLEHLHKVLLEKTLFACADMTADIEGDLQAGEGAPGGDSGRGGQPAMIRKGEVLLRVYDYTRGRFRLHTLYNHPVHTLKSFEDDGSIPGGRQFRTDDPVDSSGTCAPPDTLPAGFTPGGNGGKGGAPGPLLGEEPGVKWYPAPNPKV